MSPHWLSIGFWLMGAAASAAEAADWRAERERLANRPWRVVFDNDGMDAQFVGVPTADALLDVRTRPLVGTGVTTVFYCSRSSGLGVFTHDTKVGEAFTSQAGRYHGNITGELIRQVTDPLRIVADFCRANGIEVFWTLRMNDCHDAVHRPDRPYPAFSALKAAHPDWLLGSWDRRPQYGNWSAYDFAVPQVRDLAVACVAEVCRNYAVDGIHLDFLRHPSFFREVAAGGKATPAELDLMTDLMRRMRRTTEELGQARHRPFLLAIRVPDSMDYCRALGLDVERWLQEELVDLLVAGEFQMNPWQETVAMGRRHGVPVLAGLSESRLPAESGPFRRQARESYRGRAAAAQAAGCSGVYLFNFYDAGRPVLRELQNPSLLRNLAQWYFATIRPRDEATRWLAGGASYGTMPVLAPDHPWVLKPGGRREALLEIGDPAGRPASLYARIGAPTAKVQVTCGGEVLAPEPDEPGWSRFAVPATALRPGLNPVGFELLEPVSGGTSFTAADLSRKWAVRGRQKSETVYEELGPDGLRIVDRGTGTGDYHYRSFGWAVEPGDRVAATVRMRVLGGYNSVAFADGRHEDRLVLLPDRIRLEAAGREWAMDTTDRFHDYRIELAGTDCRILVDGVLRIDAAGDFTGAAAGSRSLVLCGAATSVETGEAIWQRVVLETDGVLLRDLVLVLPDADR